MTIDLTAIIVAIIGIIGAVLTGYVIPLLKSKVSAAQWAQFEQIVAVAVNAAEQLGIAGSIKDKLVYATEQAHLALQQYGLTFDEDTIRAAIEAEVLKLKG